MQIVALIATSLALVAMTGFAGGLYFERSVLGTSGSNAPLEISSLSTDTGGGEGLPSFSRLDSVLQLVEDEYYLMPAASEDTESFWADLEERAIEGLTVGLDGHSTYLPPNDSEAAADTLNGTYEGIGVWISSQDGVVKVVAPVPGSPAERAGIRSGDVIVEIDGVRTDGLDGNGAVEALIGPAGEQVSLMVQRPSTEEMLNFDIVREKITYPVVDYSLDEEHDIAIIHITIFGDRTVAELDAALQRAQDDGATGLILDLRNNGGGWVESAQATIGRFVDEESGPALYEDFDPSVDGDEQAEPIIGGENEVLDLPLVVLVNGGTASASEIVAGALMDYERAFVIGEQTFGKGSVQRVHEFEDGASLRLTFAHWLTPGLSAIEGQGLAPDQIVPLIDDEAGVDEQLLAAIDWFASNS
ncbi:MAG: S41 family peptidase [Thermomicrobiales bacterium]